MAVASSALFSPYRTLGLVCGGAQQALSTLGSASFLVTPIGRAFAVWRTDHLTLALVSTQAPHALTHVAAARDVTFTATAGGEIIIWARGRPIRTLPYSAADGAIVALLVLGDALVVLHEGGAVVLWDHHRASAPRNSDSDDKTLLLARAALPARVGQPTCLLHPDTYVNKVAVGTSTGSVALHNVRTGLLVHECCVMPGSPVSALAQSPAVDVVAVGGDDGRVVLYNLRADVALCAFSHSTGGAASPRVTALSFSHDAACAMPLLASATEGGALALWNLTTKAVAVLLPSAHDGPITHASFLPGQPCLLTGGGGDNAIRIWALDRIDGALSLLRSRSGHTAPPRLIRYYAGASVATMASGANAAVCEIASAGSDRTLRLFHTALDRQNCELSQGHLAAKAKELGTHASRLRLPPIVALATSDRRQGQWADVVTAHAGSSRAYCWSWEAKRIEERALSMPDSAESVVSVTISACGNFAFVGGSGGTVASFNLQSGARRGVFPPDPAAKSTMAAKGAKRRGLHPEGDGFLLPKDRDTGRGRGRGNALLAVDSVDTALLVTAGIMPPKANHAPFRAAAEGAAAREKRAAGVGRGATAAAAGGGATVEEAAGSRHYSAVYGVASDALNSIVVSCDAEGLVLWWDFEAHTPVHAIRLPSPATSLVLQRESGLAALPCDDFCVRVVDMTTRRCVRSFVGHSNRVTDVAFSADGRWLLSASLDCSVRVWDLPMGRCIDWLSFERPPVSIALSPTGEYLVTAHADSLGLCLWANRAHFGGVVIEAQPSAPTRMDMPRAVTAGEEGGVIDADAGADGEAGGGEQQQKQPSLQGSKRAKVLSEGYGGVGEDGKMMIKEEGEGEGGDPKHGCSITLSGLPSSAWSTLSKLDVIAARNKPAAPPVKPEAAPFFLPTTGGINPVFIAPTAPDAAATAAAAAAAADGIATAAATAARAGTGRIVHSHGGRAARSQLASFLRSSGTAGVIAAHLSSLAPASVDVELRSLCLGPEDDDGVALLRAFLSYIEAELLAGTRWELAQAHLALALNLHQDTLTADAGLRAALVRIAAAQAPASAHLRVLLDRGLSMVGHYLGI